MNPNSIDTGMTGFTELLALIAEHGGTPEATPVGIETDKNLIVVALVAAGFTVYPLNPRAVARYRERHSQSGCKSDARDAALLADVMRTDRHQHRPMPAITEHGLALKALARQHQEAIWAWHDVLNRLRSLLMEFYPQAVQAFPNLKHKAAIEVLALAPTPTKARMLTRQGLVAALLLRKPVLADDAVVAVAGHRQRPGAADRQVLPGRRVEAEDDLPVLPLRLADLRAGARRLVPGEDVVGRGSPGRCRDPTDRGSQDDECRRRRTRGRSEGLVR